jgi:hypothetical protein
LTAVDINVLENDFDADGDTLTITGASLETENSGSVSFTDGVLTFTPQSGFSGTASVSYVVDDGWGGTDQATVDIEVTMVDSVLVETKGGGGAISPAWLLLGGLLTAVCALGRRFLQNPGAARILVLSTVLISLALPHSVLAGDKSPWFVGGAFGWTVSDVDRGELNRDLADTGYDAQLVGVDDASAGYKLFVGRTILDSLGLEAGYLDLGEMGITVSGRYDDVEDFLASVRKIHPLSAKGVYAAGSYNWRFLKRWSAMLRAGVYSWDSDYHTRPEEGEGSAQDGPDGTDLFWGLGCRYDVTSSWSTQVLWERFDLDGHDVDYVNVGLMYRFDWPLGKKNR